MLSKIFSATFSLNTGNSLEYLIPRRVWCTEIDKTFSSVIPNEIKTKAELADSNL
jgi:hypothetical protein